MNKTGLIASAKCWVFTQLPPTDGRHYTRLEDAFASCAMLRSGPIDIRVKEMTGEGVQDLSINAAITAQTSTTIQFTVRSLNFGPSPILQPFFAISADESLRLSQIAAPNTCVTAICELCFLPGQLAAGSARDCVLDFSYTPPSSGTTAVAFVIVPLGGSDPNQANNSTQLLVGATPRPVPYLSQDYLGISVLAVLL